MIARNHLSAEDDIIAAREAEKARGSTKTRMGDTAKLGGRFDHQHPRENWSARNMPFDPEFIIANDAFAKCRSPKFREPNHSVNHPHLAALRQITIDFCLVTQSLGTVDLFKGKEECGGHILLA